MTISPDMVNSIFEYLFGGVAFLNSHKIWKERELKGAHISGFIFACLWGLWCLYYFWYLHQWFSFTGVIFYIVGNLLWMFLYIKYRFFSK